MHVATAISPGSVSPSLSFSLPLLLLLFVSLFAVSATATGAASFCKCICFNNSTIIALNPPRSSSTPTSPSSPRALLGVEPRSDHHLTCADCNRAFCLSYNLPICKEATDNDVFATCFQRDSVKDELVVVLFLVATAGLLGWALIRPWVDQFKERRRPDYLPLGLGGNTPAGNDGATGNRGEING